MLLSSPSVSSTAVSDILVNTQVLARLLGEVQLSHTSWKVRSATFAFTRSLAAAAGGTNPVGMAEHREGSDGAAIDWCSEVHVDPIAARLRLRVRDDGQAWRRTNRVLLHA